MGLAYFPRIAIAHVIDIFCEKVMFSEDTIVSTAAILRDLCL